MIEALRLISAAGKRSLNSHFSKPLGMYDLPIDYEGIKIDTDKLKIDLRNAIYFYDETIATIEGWFSDNSKIIVYISTDIAFATFFDKVGDHIWKKANIQKCDFSKISIMPQIGPIRENEKILLKQTIVNDMETYLSSRHFRNEINYLKKDKYNDLKMLAEDTWAGLRILGLEMNGEFLSLLIQDDNFPCEIGLMGSGIQIWLQIIWFLCKSKNANTMIFDEPDIYMHPDLQIKLYEILQKSKAQIIIATHSVEIISQTEPRYIASIDKDTRKIVYANDGDAVQKIVEEIGGISNLSLIRIGQFKKCLFVEGKDLKILAPIAKKLYPKAEQAIDLLPQVKLEGKSQLAEAYGVAKLFYSETRGKMNCFCILDRDYDTEEKCEKTLLTAKDNYLQLIIWKRKEIENYLLIPQAIFRAIKSESKNFVDFEIQFLEIIESYKNYMLDQYSEYVYEEDRSLAHSTCNKMARERLKREWTTIDNKIQIIPGKDALKKIREMIKKRYNSPCSNLDIIRQITSDEISDDIKTALAKIYGA